MSNEERKVIKVGQGATYNIGSDRYPYTVVEILSPKRIVVQADDYRRTDKNGFSESQTYVYESNPSATKVVLTLRKNGRWIRVGESMKAASYSLNGREAYLDPSF